MQPLSRSTSSLVLYQWLLALCIGLIACTPYNPFNDESEPLPAKSDSEIPYTALVFGETVKPQNGGGWQAMCLHLRLQRHIDDVSEGRSAEFTCVMEIGFPILPGNRNRIHADEAQRITAAALNEAMKKMRTDGTTFTVCKDLKTRTRRLIQEKIKKAKLEQCRGSSKVPLVEWP